jgi:hypothetical protein
MWIKEFDPPFNVRYRDDKGAADHLYRVDAQLLVVPQLLDDMVRAWRWAPVEDDAR